MSKPAMIGRTLGGKYEIKQLIGKGGMATVYRGYQADVDRDVAVKVLLLNPALSEEFAERFRLEARTIARLQHPHILPLYDYGVEDGILYLVTAYVSGGTLSDRIARGPLPVDEVDTLLRQIAPALDYAHRQGIVHRDIKPANILITAEGHPLLADFGIAKLAEGDARLTATGGLIGTPAYMAPEQVQGLQVGPSADIYSLGVVVFEMLSGRQPYTAETPMQVLVKHIAEPVPALSTAVEGLPPTLDAVLALALAKNPEQRYPSAAAFAADYSRAICGAVNTVGTPLPAAADTSHTINLLDTPAPGTAGAAPPTSPPTTPPPTQPQTIIAAGGQPVLLAGLGVIAVLVLVIAVLVLATINRDNPVIVAGSPTAAAGPPTPTVEAGQPVQSAPAAVRPLGRLTFSTANRIGDTANLRLERLAPTEPGMSYAVWLLNTDTGDRLGLGALTVDPLGNGVLSYTDPEGRSLPTLFNTVAITRETFMEDAPTTAPRYGGRVPVALTRALHEILISSEASAGGESSLDGALEEDEFAALHAGLAAEASSVAGMHAHAEHTINILLGAEDDLDGNGRGENPGRSKRGVPYFLDLIVARLDAAIEGSEPETLTASDPNLAALLALEPDTRRLHSDAELIRVCIDNTYRRVQQLIELERALLAATSTDAAAPQAAEALRVADQLINGFDLNRNGQIEAFEGECGLRQIPVFSVIVGSVDVLPLETNTP
ncbi:MAG: serine/threonine-protein kinase [Aggregatilineales bacterium]